MVSTVTPKDKERIFNRDMDVMKTCLKAYMEQMSDLADMVTNRIREINGAFKDEIILTRTGIVFAINMPMLTDDLAVQACAGVSCRKAIQKLQEALDAEN